MSSNVKKYEWILFLILAVFLLSVQFIQHGSYGLDGDMTAICLPIETYEPAFKDPFGFELLKSNPKLYSGTNRFFCTYFCYLYLNKVPLWLQHVTSPMYSVFLAIQCFKMLTLMLGILVIFIFVRLFTPSKLVHFPLVACFTLLLFQNEGFYEQIGIIDHSIVYTFFYGFSILLIFLLFYPFVKSYVRHRSLNILFIEWLYVLPLMLIVPFFGSINAPFVLYSILFCVVFFVFSPKVRPSISYKTFTLLVFLFLLCLYSQYISYFNIENPTSSPSVMERYRLLAKGIFYLFSKHVGLGILLSIICFNIYWLSIKNHKLLRQSILFILTFTLGYLFLLPLGGFREYRPFIIRYDNFIPISLLIFIVLLATSAKVYKSLPMASLYKRTGVLVVALIFFLNNFQFSEDRKHTELELKKIQKSSVFSVKINNNVKILNWKNTDSPEESYYASLLLRRWKVINRDFRFYQK